MKWIKCKSRLPSKGQDYLIRYTYSDKGSERRAGMRCRYDSFLKAFDIEIDNLPQCQVIEWATLNSE